MWYSSIDDVLGPAPQRYFGEGYRGVRVRVASKDATGAVPEIKGYLEYPSAWSSRRGVVRHDRHLGTIDAVVLACRATELTSVGTGPLQTIEIAAPTSPTVGTGAVPIAIVGADGQHFSYRIGELRVSVGMAGHREPRGSDETPGWMKSWHTTSTGVLRLDDIEIDIDAGVARATATKMEQRPSRWSIDSNAGGVSAADAIAAAGAMTEATLFQRAKVQRDDVGNFWMRRAHIDFVHSSPQRPNGPISVETVRSHVFPRGQSRWHSARVHVVSELGFRIAADVAFEERLHGQPLPQEAT